MASVLAATALETAMSWLSGIKKLAASAVIEVTDLVQKTHRHAAKQQVQRLQLIEPIGQAAELIDGVHMAIADTGRRGLGCGARADRGRR
jgi:hypothetical protein